MKKFFAIAAIATAMVACNNSSEKKGDDKDTTKMDTISVTPPATDTAATPKADTTATPKADTAATKM